MKSSVLIVAQAALLAGLLALPAWGAPFGVKPTAATIDAKKPVAEFFLSSLSARPTIFEVRVERWWQTGGADTYARADMRVVPAVFALSPYQERLIRVAARGELTQGEAEQSYRVRITAVVPGQTVPPDSAARFDTVFFIAPRAESGETAFAISATGTTARLTVTNAANHHVYVGSCTIDANGKELYRGPALGYVLAGSTRTFTLALSEKLGGSPQLRFEDEAGSQRTATLHVLP